MYILLIIVAFVLYIKFKANDTSEKKQTVEPDVFEDLKTSSTKPKSSDILEDFAKQGTKSKK